MLRIHRLIQRIADSNLSVLFVGETGVGKDVYAELLHSESPRSRGRWLRLNCAALPTSLFESELFGHERGAFTGAVAVKPGLLEEASGGTLFLDEIGEMPLETQTKLLRVLESQEVLRLGATKTRSIDVRVIAATNQNLTQALAEGRFRKDLFFRIAGFIVHLPPLRERLEDIEPLARFFLAQATRRAPPPELSREAIGWLRSHSWPGNVRELRNAIERAAVLCDSSVVEVCHFGHDYVDVVRLGPHSLTSELRQFEGDRIDAALKASNGNQHAAARMLGISRGKLRRRLQR